MLLGILSGLGDLLSGVFNTLFNAIIRNMVIPIVKVAIQVAVTVFQYAFATLFYEVSVFLLKLIDFVEVLFRALAGLESTAGNSSITFSLNNKSGDLLLQMLTSQDVINVFLATAVVGVFLLIITTIFQMIKVEYTTEGANNSKSGIIGKSLKSLCNMIIIPLLVIFGVVIGNQVLDLIDTATGGNDGSKISGTLWVTAASTAMLKETDSFVKAAEDMGIISGAKDYQLDNAGGLLGFGISLALDRGFYSLLNGGKEAPPLVALGDNPDRAGIENGFMSVRDRTHNSVASYKYYNVTDVIKYYDPFNVNYLVLIFGACIIIKCLYYVCFGLVDRLYRCTALFIVMPMVVGMSPVKDSLGSWRQSFISRALSAYGSVISLNLFFIIVKIMLNINIEFGSDYNDWIFPTSFMEGLIKSIMVIVGCLMIEKLAGDMGNYFGGGNAMAEGKGLAKEATAGLAKAATVAGGIAMGGVGIASKIGKGVASNVGGLVGGIKAKKTGQGTFASGFANKKQDIKDHGIIGGTLGKTKFGQAVGSTVHKVKKGAVSYATNGIFKTIANKQALNKANANLDSANANLDSANSELSEANKAKEDNKTWFTNDGSINNRLGKKKKAKAQAILDRINNAEKSVADAQGGVESAKSGVEKAQDEIDKDDQKTANALGKGIEIKEGTRQMIKNKFGLGTMVNNFAPKSISGLGKQYQDAVKQAMDTPEGQQIEANLKKAEADKKEEAFNNRNSNYVNMRRAQVTALEFRTAGIKLEQSIKESNDQIDKMVKALASLKNSFEDSRTTNRQKDAITDQAFALQSQLKQLNSSIQFDGSFDIKTDAHIKFDKDALQKVINDAIKKNAKSEDIVAAVKAELTKMGLASPEQANIIKELYKQLQEIKNNLPNK